MHGNNIYIYIYIYICVCVCVSNGMEWSRLDRDKQGPKSRADRLVANIEGDREAQTQTQDSGSERHMRKYSAQFHLTPSLVQPRTLSCDT
jgi:hypothetical protein